MSLASGDVFARDSLSNLAASLNAGRDKAAGDAFFVFDLGRGQVEAMYRGDWLARKVVDIVPYDMVREWRAWSGDRAAVAAAELAEKRFGLRKLVQRALTLGRLYGGGAIIIGTGESDPAALASELVPDRLRPGDIKFLHGVSRWQLSAPTVNRDPLSRWFGEPDLYEITAPTRGALQLHPSRVIRFLGNELPDPWLGVSAWSDSVLQTLYDAVHAVALTTTGATSLMHEAKVDVVTVPNLSEHLSSAATTEQLSARFSYAAAMKSLNNLLLLGDGETWSRQKIDFAGLPEMVRTFLQVAAGAADIPVTRLLGQSPAGMSATGESDTRNYYDMIASRQAIDLRPKLERLDQLILRSAGVDPDALSFEFRPLWQMDAAASAAIALQKAQATQIYAGLGLWPAATTAALVQSQLIEDGTYPGAEIIFEAAGQASRFNTDFNPDQLRDPQGRWTTGSEKETAGTGGAQARGGEPPSRSPAFSKQGPHAPDGTPITLAGDDPEAGGNPDIEQALEKREEARPQAIVSGSGLGSQPDELAPVKPPAPVGLPRPIPPIQSLQNNVLGIANPEPSPQDPYLTSSSEQISKHLIPGIVGPGPYARENIPLQPGVTVSSAMRLQNTANGYAFGCHRCGTKDPGTHSGAFIFDHQIPTAVNRRGALQFGYPHCYYCSNEQGGRVRDLKQKGFWQ